MDESQVEKLTRDGALWEAVRAVATEALQSWVGGFEPLVNGEEPLTLRSLSAHIFATRNQLIGTVLEAVILHALETYRDQRRAECPSCARTLFRKRSEPKEISTLHGSFVLDRPYFYCGPCKLGFVPIDEVLELAKEVHQYDVQELLTRFAAKMPYDEAVETVKMVTSIELSAHTAHATVERVAETTELEAVLPSAEEIARRIDEAREQEGEDVVVVVAADGAMAPTRPRGGRRSKRGPGRWREVKGFRIFIQGKDSRIVTLASWHQISDAEALSQALGVAAARLPKEGVRIGLVGDGAQWVWNVLQRHFPDARQVLDYYHGKEHVFDCAHAHYEDTLDAQQWAQTTMARLQFGHVSEVLGGLRRMLPKSYEAREAIETLIAYLEKNRHRLAYQECKEDGLPMGSGAMESAHRSVVHKRMKLPGAWWLETNGNGMLRLRCALANGTLDKILSRYVAAKHRPHFKP